MCQMANEHPRRRFFRQIAGQVAGFTGGFGGLSRPVSGVMTGLGVLAAGMEMAQAAGFADALGYAPKYPPNFHAFGYVNPDAPRGGRLVLSAFGTFDSLNPFVLKGLSPMGMSQLCFESLTVRSWDEPFSVYGLLADRGELADDGLSVVFRINAKARFRDGSPVTAEDVKFSFDTLTGPKAHPRYRYYWADISGAELVDARHVRFHFRRVNPELHLIIGELPVFSKYWVGNRDFGTLARETFMTSGPYMVGEINFGSDIAYERRPDYWGWDLNVRRGCFNFDKVVFKYYKDETVSLEAFKAHEFDVFYETNSKRWARDYHGPPFREHKIVRKEIPHHNNAGMQGFAMNTRRALFKDRRVRRALDLAFDFGWSNKHLFYGQYTRCDSYFSNSELAATGIPQGDELALLEPFRDQLPPELFTEPYQVPVSNTPMQQRQNLLKARDLLHEAGWRVRDGVLRNEQGEPFQFEIMLAMRGFERIVAPYAYNLRRLGIEVSYRTIDVALYQRRLDRFDFDMTVVSYAGSQSPGNELFDEFGSKAAKREGSSNYAGIDSPVVDALIRKVVYAKDRAHLVTAVHALDRVLMWGEYLVPNWYIGAHRLAWWDRFAYHDKPLPLYYDALPWVIQTWWQTRPNVEESS